MTETNDEKRQGGEPQQKSTTIGQTQKAIQETNDINTLRELCFGLNATAQMALRALHAVAKREIELNTITGGAGSLLVCYTEPGKDLRDDVAKQLITLMKMPMVILDKNQRLDVLKPETLEAAGWTRLGVRGLVDAEGKPVSK